MKKSLVLLSVVAALSLSGGALAATEYNAITVVSAPVYLAPGVHQLARAKAGERVIVTSCTAVTNGWCYVQRVGIDGWVKSSALRAAKFGSGSGSSFGQQSGPDRSCTTQKGATVCISR